jgi:hypothetical protein
MSIDQGIISDQNVMEKILSSMLDMMLWSVHILAVSEG